MNFNFNSRTAEIGGPFSSAWVLSPTQSSYTRVRNHRNFNNISPPITPYIVAIIPIFSFIHSYIPALFHPQKIL